MFKYSFLLLLCISNFSYAKNLKNNTCKINSKLSLLYLNGVGNNEDDAGRSIRHILNITNKKGPLENVANSEICSGILYNQTYGIGRG
jgi:hypothetical protein